MTTDNRTNEMIVAEALTMLPEKMRLHIATRAVKTLRAAGRLAGEPADALALVEEVIAIHADRIGTHYEDCYKYHVACLAVEVKHRLGGATEQEGENDE